MRHIVLCFALFALSACASQEFTPATGKALQSQKVLLTSSVPPYVQIQSFAGSFDSEQDFDPEQFKNAVSPEHMMPAKLAAMLKKHGVKATVNGDYGIDSTKYEALAAQHEWTMNTKNVGWHLLYVPFDFTNFVLISEARIELENVKTGKSLSWRCWYKSQPNSNKYWQANHAANVTAESAKVAEQCASEIEAGLYGSK